MNPKDVVSYIEGEPFISVVPVEPGLTNAGKIPSDDGLKDGQRIVGLNTENAEINVKKMNQRNIISLTGQYFMYDNTLNFEKNMI